MQTKFTIETRKTNGDLYVEARGDLDGSSAMQLVNVLHAQYSGTGKVYIETGGLRDICPFGCDTFRCRLDGNRLPADRLFFKGKEGFKMAPKGSMVIGGPRRDRCRCNGQCKNCRCEGKGHHQNH